MAFDDSCTAIYVVPDGTVHPLMCSCMNGMYTATEDRMTVLTVGCCLRQTVIWSFMFVFTLVQSRIHVDTVHSILHSHLKRHLLKSHNEGTWLTCNICQKNFTTSTDLKQHLLRHDGVKPYVCSQCPKCFCTMRELKSHQLVHSDYKQFCCGLCSKDFKHKRYVVHHFKKFSLKLRFCDV